MEKLRYFFRIEVAYQKKEWLLSHKKYVLDLLQATSLLGCKTVSIPMKLDVDFYNEDSEVYNNVKQYMEIIRELIDLMVTIPNIPFVVGFQVSSCICQVRFSDSCSKVFSYIKSSPGGYISSMGIFTSLYT